MMTGSDFIYDGKKLSDFGLIMAKSDSEDNSGLNRELLKGNATAYRSEANHYGAKYSETMLLNFLIVKDPCTFINPYINEHEIRNVYKWLTSYSVPKPLLVQNEDKTIEYDGVFTTINPSYSGDLIGLFLTFTCNSPFAYMPRKEVFDNQENNSYVIYCDSDEMDYILPTIKIEPYESGEIVIVNEADGQKEMRFNVEKEKEYLFDCKYKRILIDGIPSTLSDVGWNYEYVIDYNNVNTGVFKNGWLRLLPMPQKNKININGSAKFTFEYKNKLKVGGLYA